MSRGSGLRGGPVKRLFVLGASCLLSAALVCHAEDLDAIFPDSELSLGKTISREECAGLRYAVWVEHQHGTECLRYYPSARVDSAKHVIFYLSGDLLNFSAPVNYGKLTASVLMSHARGWEKRIGMPVIYLARPGTYGSSGDHKFRRRPKEMYSVNAALDAIKARHRIEGLVLAGQSGGAAVAIAMLTLGRTDVACVVGTSGVYSAVERQQLLASQRGSRGPIGVDETGYPNTYDVIDYVGRIKPDPSRRILLVGDPEDRNTAFKLQRSFAEKVRRAGHAVVLLEAEGQGPDRHLLEHLANPAAAMCARDMPLEHIVEWIGAKLVSLEGR